MSQIVFRVFRWRDGRYQFNAADAVDYDRENFVPMSTDFILMEGIRMVDEWPIIEKRIHSFDMVFRPVVDPSLIEVGEGAGPEGSGSSSGRVAASSTGRIRLGADEERVFRKVDGVRTVQGIIDATGSGEFEVCRTLFDFLNRNLIAPAGRGSAAEAEGAEVAGTGSALPGYAVAALVSALALAGLGGPARRALRGDGPRPRPARHVRRGQGRRAALAARRGSSARSRRGGRPTAARRPRSTSWWRPRWSSPATCSTPGRARSATRPLAPATA